MSGDRLTNLTAREHLTGESEPWIPGENLCGCDGVPCRTNSVVEDDETLCGSCEQPCHSVETV